MSFSALVHSEWIKVRSLRSHVGALAAVPLGTAAVSALLCGARVRTGQGAAALDPLELSYSGLTFGQMAAVAFGAMVMGAEYRNGALRVSLSAVPRRGRFYAAKLAVTGGLALAVGAATSLLAFFTGRALLDRSAGISVPDALRAMVGCELYVCLVAVLAAGLTALLRSLTGALGILVPLFLILPFVLGDPSKGGGAADYLPDRAGRQILLQDPTGSLGPWSGMAVLVGWAALAAAAGWWAVRRRDA